MVRKKVYRFDKSDLTKKPIYCGAYDMPYVKASNKIPEDVITFEKALKSKDEDDYNKWVVFYIEDYEFEKLWNNPKKYLPRLKKFKGAITPDFSICADMPYPVKIMNSYRSKLLGVFFNENGIDTIPNVRWCDEETLQYSTDGIEKHSNIFIGTLGCRKNLDDRKLLIDGFDFVCKELEPNIVLSYGTIPKEMVDICIKYEIPFKEYIPQITKLFSGGNYGA